MVSLNSEEDTEEEDEEIEDDSSVLLPSMRIITERGNITYITYDNVMILYLSCCCHPQLVFLLKI